MIVDKRGLALANGTIMQGLGGPYNVSVVLKVRGRVAALTPVLTAVVLKMRSMIA